MRSDDRGANIFAASHLLGEGLAHGNLLHDRLELVESGSTLLVITPSTVAAAVGIVGTSAHAQKHLFILSCGAGRHRAHSG